MALAPIFIDFQIRNMPQVQKALQGVAATVAQAESKSTAASLKGTSERARTASREASEKIRAIQRVQAFQEAAERSGSRAAARAAQADMRAAIQAANEKLRAMQRVAAEEQRLRSQTLRASIARSGVKGLTADHPTALAAFAPVKHGVSSPEIDALRKVKAQQQLDALADKSAKDKIRAMQAADRAAERAARDGVKTAEKRARDEARAFDRGEQEKNRAALKWVREREAEERRADAAAAARRKHMAATVVGAGGKAFKSAAGLAARGASAGLSAVAGAFSQVGGGFSVADAIQQQIDIEHQAALLSNATDMGINEKTGKETRVSKDDILKTVRASSIETSTDQSELMKGLNAFTAKTGRYDVGAKDLSFYSKISKATGADLESVMKTAGTMTVQNENLAPEDQLDADQLRKLTMKTVMQARKGSVEFEDMAKAGGKITRTAVAYAGDQGQHQSELLGLSQIGMKTAGNDVAEAATALANVSSDASKHKGDVEQLLGHKFKNERGQITSGPGEFIAELMAASGGNLDKLQAAGFGKQSMKAFQAASGTYNDAEDKYLKAHPKDVKGAREAGKQAILAEQKRISAGNYDEKKLDAEFSKVMNTSAEQFEASMRRLRLEVGEKLVPELTKLVPVLSKLMPTITQLMESFVKLANRAAPTIGTLLDQLAKVTEWAASNPFEGFAALVTGFFLKELIAAKIGDTIKSILAGGGGAPGAGGAGGAAGGAIGLGIAAQSYAISDLVGERYGAVQSGKEQGAQIAADLKSGDPAKAAAAQKALDQAKGKASGVNTASAYVDTASRGLQAVVNPFGYIGQKLGDYAAEKINGTSTAKQSVEALKANEIVNAPELKDTIAKAVADGMREGVKQAAPPAPPDTRSLINRK